MIENVKNILIQMESLKLEKTTLFERNVFLLGKNHPFSKILDEDCCLIEDFICNLRKIILLLEE